MKLLEAQDYTVSEAANHLELLPSTPDTVLGFVREHDGQRLVVFANFADETQVDTSAYLGATELLTGETVGETLTLGEMGMEVLELTNR